MQQLKQPGAADAAAQERRGLWLYLLNGVLVSVLGVFSKLASHAGVPFFELVLARSVAMVLCTVPLLARDHINPFAHHDKYVACW